MTGMAVAPAGPYANQCTDRQRLQHLITYRPDALPNQQCQSTEGNTQVTVQDKLFSEQHLVCVRVGFHEVFLDCLESQQYDQYE